jgi:Family of unknown function (DUF5681)
VSEKRKITAANSSRSGAVGYGRPPVETRFKPGVSGNPAGRPKQSRNLKTIIRNALTAHVTVREGEKKRSVTKLEGIVLRQLESALKGNEKAALATLKMAAQVGLLEVGDAEMEPTQLSTGEQQIIDELLANQGSTPRRSKRRAKVSKS